MKIGEAGEDLDPPVLGVARLVQQRAPGRDRAASMPKPRKDTADSVRIPAATENAPPRAPGEHGVGQHVAEDRAPRVGEPQRARREHELLLAQAQELAAHEARHARPAHDADHDHDVDDRRDGPDRREGEGDQDQEERGNRLDDLDAAQIRRSTEPAEVAGEEPITTPMIVRSSAERMPTERLMRPPQSMRASMSRPRLVRPERVAPGMVRCARLAVAVSTRRDASRRRRSSPGARGRCSTRARGAAHVAAPLLVDLGVAAGIHVGRPEHARPSRLLREAGRDEAGKSRARRGARSGGEPRLDGRRLSGSSSTGAEAVPLRRRRPARERPRDARGRRERARALADALAVAPEQPRR